MLNLDQFLNYKMPNKSLNLTGRNKRGWQDRFWPVKLAQTLEEEKLLATYILPGMGADSSMYGEASRKLEGVKYINWPSYNNEHSISEVAKWIIQEVKIQAQDTIGGSSLGGIIAAEISKHVIVNKLILIGSTLTPDNINPLLKKLSALSVITPVNFIQAFAGKANSIHENKLLKMFSHSEPLFIKSMCTAVFEWDGNKKPNCAVSHVHGEKDNVILPPSNGAEIIKGGGHLIALTHETSVVEFIRRSLTP